jgi:hypothetical protein
VSAQESQGRHDSGAVRQSLRKQRERGCSIYIAAAELRATGLNPADPAPGYRIWPGRRGRLVVTLYPL